MARPERNTVDYFPFICDEGKKMFYIEETYGNDGFATFIKILRELAKTEYHFLDLSKTTTQMFLSAKCKVSKEILLSIIGDLTELGKFDSYLWNEFKVIWCQDFIDSIQDAYKKRNNECITFEGLHVLLTSLGILKPQKDTLIVPVKPQRKEKKSIEDKRILNNIENAKILNEFSRSFFDQKYITDKSISMFDALLEKYSIEKIKESIKNAKANEFWSKNFLTPMKLNTKDKTDVLYIDVFLNLKPLNNQQQGNTKKMVHYEMNGYFYTHHEVAYNQNLKSLGSDKVKFLNYVEDGN